MMGEVLRAFAVFPEVGSIVPVSIILIKWTRGTVIPLSLCPQFRRVAQPSSASGCYLMNHSILDCFEGLIHLLSEIGQILGTHIANDSFLLIGQVR